MPRLSRLALALSLAALVAGCQLALPGGKASAPQDVTANAITGGAIETVALDGPPASETPDTAAAPAAAGGLVAAQPTPGSPTAAATLPAPTPDLAKEDAPPATPKSDRQKACEKKGGTWAGTGKGDLRICVYPTRDAGKQCTRESQCDGVCLARSGTCAPVKPLLGCNEILQANGARVTLCIE